MNLKEGDLGMLIGHLYLSVCRELENNNDNSERLISELSEGLSYLNKSNTPPVVMLLWLLEYAKKVN